MKHIKKTMNGISLYIIYWYTISKKTKINKTFIFDAFYAINYAGRTSLIHICIYIILLLIIIILFKQPQNQCLRLQEYFLKNKN